LAANLATIPDVQVSAYLLSSPTPPAVYVVGPGQVEYHRAMVNGLDNWTMLIQATAGLTTDQGAQIRLDGFIGATGASSVKAAVESDRTLGGKAQDTVVQSCAGYQLYQTERGVFLGAEWTVLVLASGA